MTTIHKSHIRIALEDNYEEMKRRAAHAPKARSEATEINEITKMSVAKMVPALREFAAKLRADRPTSEGPAKLAEEAAAYLEADHIDRNAYAILHELRDTMSRSASHLEGIDPEAHNPGPWPPVMQAGSRDTYREQMTAIAERRVEALKFDAQQRIQNAATEGLDLSEADAMSQAEQALRQQSLSSAPGMAAAVVTAHPESTR